MERQWARWGEFAISFSCFSLPTHTTAEFSSLLSRCRCKMEIFLSTIWRHNKRRVENYRKTAEVSVESIMSFPTILDDAAVLKLNSLAWWKPPLSTMETLHVICANESNFNVEAACSRVLLSLGNFLTEEKNQKFLFLMNGENSVFSVD